MNPQELATLFAKNVLRILSETGVTQAELAAKIGKKEPNISRMCAAKTIPSGTTIASVAEALGVDVCELLCESKPRKKGK